MGQARNAAAPTCRSALRKRLSLRRDLSRPRRRGRACAALRRHRGDATPSRGNLRPCRRGRPRRAAARPRRMAHHRQARPAPQHHPDLPAFPRAGTEPGREHLAVSYEATGFQTSSSKPTTTSSTPPATPGENSSPSQKQSPQSACANGPISVRPRDSWYNPLKTSPRLQKCGAGNGRLSVGRAFDRVNSTLDQCSPERMPAKSRPRALARLAWHAMQLDGASCK